MLVGWHWTAKSHRDAIGFTGHRYPDVGDGER